MAAITHKYRSGFSLIELMIVIAILGIIAAVGIPAYSDYVIRARVGGMITAVEPLKEAVAEYWMTNGNLNSIDPANAVTSLTVLGAADPTLLSSAINNVQFTVANDNYMSIVICGSTTGQGTASTDTVDIYLEGIYVVSGITWACAYAGNSRYVPSSCRTLYDPTTFGTVATPCVH